MLQIYTHLSHKHKKKNQVNDISANISPVCKLDIHILLQQQDLPKLLHIHLDDPHPPSRLVPPRIVSHASEQPTDKAAKAGRVGTLPENDLREN